LKAIDVTPDPQVPGVFAVQIDPPLPALLLTDGATVYGNIGKATQGESQNLKVLGSGDASQPWQEFVLKSQPVTYVLDPSADRGARSTLQVFVNSEQWAEVASFYGAGPDDKIFITMLDPDGSTRIRFGDGATGRRLPTGSNNVMAMWRKGAGSDGNVDAGAVTILTKPVTGLRSVINPMAATGGAEGESNDALRVNAPSSVLTLDRAVSLRDYESLSLTYPGVAKASAWWAEFGDERGVALTVAAAGSKALADLAGSLRNFLDDHRDPNVPLSIADYTKVPFTLRLKVFVNAARLQSSVQTAVAAAIAPDLGSGYLSFARLGFGQSIFSSAILAAVQDVSGVDWVEMIEFSVPSPWQDHAFGDNSDLLDAVYIGPGEIGWPTLDGDMTASSIGITYSGGVLEAGS
jgi:predicted phage baseplate assembly protein